MEILKELNRQRELRYQKVLSRLNNSDNFKDDSINKTRLDNLFYYNNKLDLVICDPKYKDIHAKKATKVIIICPLSRPQFAQRLIDNFTRQIFENKILIVIENKDAIGTFKHNGDNIIVLNSEPGQSQAKNVGLQYIRDNFPGEFWTTFDDDDYYGEKYLSELIDNSNNAQIIGKLNTFMLDSANHMKCLEFEEEKAFVTSIWGWSLSSWIQDIDFPILSCGEDNAWLEQAKMSGAKIYATSKYNACYNRSHGENTWVTTDDAIYRNCKNVNLFETFDPDIVNNVVDFKPARKKRR